MKNVILTLLAVAMCFTVPAQTLIDITVSSNVFTPANITINQGDTVRWTNVQGFHNVNGTIATYPSNPASFGNAVAGPGWTYTFVFNIPGFYDYRCDPHFGIGMVGTVTVIAVDNTNDDWITTGANTTTMGNVTIGTSIPATGYLLSVDGRIMAEEIQILDSGVWPDYVFNKDYKLMPLKDVDNYVKQNKHLPGVPSAKTVEEEGISVGEMSKVLLEKVEELTLHLIEQSKKVDVQSEQIKKLQEENIELRNMVKQ